MILGLVQISFLIYYIASLIFLKNPSSFATYSPLLLFLALSFAARYFKIEKGIQNLLIILIAFSVYVPYLQIFLIYLPFALFGHFLRSKNFIKNYICGFTISFIPSCIIYLVSTYLNVSISLPLLYFIFFFPCIVMLFILKKKSLDPLKIDNKEVIIILSILFFSILFGLGINEDKTVFMANGAREYYRLHNTVNGLFVDGKVPVYDPNIGTGESTFLWVSPPYFANISVVALMLSSYNPIFLFNVHSAFILLLSVMALSLIFTSILPKEMDFSDMIALIPCLLLTGFNFYFLQGLESIKQFYTFPIAYLFISIILEGVKKAYNFLFLIFIAVLIVTIHPAYGVGVIFLGTFMFILTNASYVRDKTQVKQLLHWIFINKIVIAIVLIAAIITPIYYISSGIIFKDFLIIQKSDVYSLKGIYDSAFTFFRDFSNNELKFLSIKYPDVNRIDDHKFGFSISVFGVLSAILMMAVFFRRKEYKKYRIFAFAFLINLLFTALFNNIISLRVGGFYRAVPAYFLILLGISTFMASTLLKKQIKMLFAAIVFIGFLHTVPTAASNFHNIHQESFLGGETYANEIAFTRSLPADGRFMTYGLFNNVIDYGMILYTDRFFSRSERIELAIDRSIHEKIHGQTSYGDEAIIVTKSATELYNYLRLGGYKYLFMDVRYPAAYYVANNLYPNLSTGVYQNGPLLFFIVNNVSYAEKVNLVNVSSNEIYKQPDGYKYVAPSIFYGFDHNEFTISKKPIEPIPVVYERPQKTKIVLKGDFKNNDYVVVKEQYFTRWKAKMDGQEIPVFATNFDVILIKTLQGDEIELEYLVLPIERILGTLSLIGTLAFLALFFVMSYRNPD